MPQDESEKYLSLLKKGLSGGLGRNLIDIVFSTAQVMDSDEHRLLTALRDSELKDAEARNRFYQTVIDSLEMEDCNCLLYTSPQPILKRTLRRARLGSARPSLAAVH